MMIRFTYPTVEKICFRIILNYLLVMVFLAITTVSFFIIGASVLRGQPDSYPRGPNLVPSLAEGLKETVGPIGGAIFIIGGFVYSASLIPQP